jgi:hypothetical protein
MGMKKMSGLSHFMPARGAKLPVKVISDLDDLVAQPIGFRYLGEDYIIAPMTTRNFMIVTQALHELEETLKKQNGEWDDESIYQAYYEFISPLCPGISLKKIKKGTISQLHALLNLMVRHITGQTEPDMVREEEEKKKIQIQKHFKKSNFSRSLLSFLGFTRSVSKK